MPLEIVTIPCLSDNYAYLLRDQETGKTAVVDVPEAGPIAAELASKGWDLDYILITHHHFDHIDGVPALRKKTGAQVVGAADDAKRLPPLDIALKAGDTFDLGSERCDIIDVSGHTIGHIAFIFRGALAGFTADSLMAWGCGRVFEGTMAQQWQTLEQFLSMPEDMMIYSGHEYTESNARFALSIEPDNPAYQARAAEVQKIRAKGGFTVPSRLGEEFATNPFLRAHLPEVKALVGLEGAPDADVFAEIRTRKDNF